MQLGGSAFPSPTGCVSLAVLKRYGPDVVGSRVKVGGNASIHDELKVFTAEMGDSVSAVGSEVPSSGWD